MTEQTAPQTPRAAIRLNWLDIARGVALIAMASYHFMWDLADFGYLEPDFPSSGWPKLYARTIASTFLFLAGFSLVLAHGDRIRWQSFRKRLLILIGAAALVTVATYFAIPRGFVFFGILHAIAAASLIGLVFLRVPWPLTFLVAAATFIAPQYLRSDFFNEPWLWWIGLSTELRVSFDYVPLLPWLAPFLSGIAIGRISALTTWLRQNASGDKPRNWAARTFSFLGRHSLVFYLVHQPVLISILYVVSLIHPATGHPEAFVQKCVADCVQNEGEAFCKRFCECAVNDLQRESLLAPLQSGAMPAAYQGKIDTIRSQCTVEAEPAN